jgi:signal transduction histidine kinase
VCPRSEADSLNAVSYALRYKDLDASAQAAEAALGSPAATDAARAESLNNLGFCAFMRMDFERADSLYAAASAASMSELERLVADVGRMKINQRTARYKAFCDYRNSARTRLRRLDDDGSLSASPRLAYARSECAIASSVYYYYLRQVPQAVEAIESIPVDEALQRDTAQWLYYLYMRGSGDLAPGDSPEEVTLHEFDYLWPCLTISYRQGYTYFDANASQALAEMMMVPEQFALVNARRPALMKMLNPRDLPGPDLAMSYARRALEGFEDYGDLYQISGALRTIASCYNWQGLHAGALDYLSRALQMVNRHHEQFYLCTDTADRLRPYVPFDSAQTKPVELCWIQDEGIQSVPEWIARLREQLSMTYAALGMKPQSDYNRNIYLDLLDYTRQDKETESRYAALKADGERLNGWLLAVAVALVVIIAVCVVVNRTWRRRNWRYIYRLQHVAQLCRRISSSDAEEAAAAHQEMLRLRASFPRRLNRDEQLQAEVMDAYLRGYDEAGRQIETLAEERECIEKERYVHQRHLVENKQENLVKRACLLVVTGILPYIDRALYTMKRLDCDAQLAYLDELLARINEHNDILALWIKMKPGSLSLHIESFPLAPLFEVVGKGRQSFEQRRQTLSVQSTEAAVKADKALTLFMINTLTDNARKYTQPGGTIRLSATEGDDYVEVSVADNGPGIPAEEVERLMSEKVYDAGKGHGFGLMNCRGIIEKYRKTNALFRVCTFGVESEPGHGSRFYFRLPKSVKVTLVVLWAVVAGCLPAAADTDTPSLAEANRFADLTYQCNVEGYYEDAILYADSALAAMNEVMVERASQAMAGGDSTLSRLPLLSLEGQGDAAEVQWWAAGYDTDYFILLDVRNEAAVASLALGQMEKYRYNNTAYTALYKQLSADTQLEDYCRRMQRSAGAKTVLLVIVLLAVVALSVHSYLRYFHRRLIYRDRMEQILLLSRRLVDGAAGEEPPSEANQETDWEPTAAPDDDPFVRQWIADLTALRTYYSRVWMGGKREDIEAVRDEVNRLTREENRLHVQNRVLDNCLSALKHETVYYPHRIRQWVEKARAGAPENASADAMVELMTYYKEIYTTLTACAARQLDEVTFRRATLKARGVVDEARRTFARLARRHQLPLVLQADADDAEVMADEVELQYLLTCLMQEALTHPAPGQLQLTARTDGAFVRFTLTDPRRTLTPEQLATLFDPHIERMRYVDGDRLTGVEYLIAKQVIRDHDAYAGRRGCRMQAETSPMGQGLTVWFTLPRNSYKNIQV